MEAYLYLEAHIKAIEPVTDFTYRWCTAMGMHRDEAAQFTLAVDELLTDMILFAYPEDVGYVEIWYRYSLPQLEIIIQESGEPFDPENYRYSPDKVLAEGDFTGAGLELVRKLTDHFLFLNRGRDGKEFRLAKQLSEKDYSDIQQYIDGIPSEAEEENFSYTLMPVTKEDAEDIAKLIYRSYDYSYSKEDLYFPKQNEMAIEHGKKFGTIVRTTQGRPVGYFTVIKASDSLIGEVGEAVVSPPHRKRGLMKRMMNELINMSKKRGIMGLYGLALTVHTISQKVNQAFGFHSTALLVAITRGSKHKEFITDNSQPKSILVDFLPLNKNWNPSVFLPDRYHSFLQKQYRQFQVPLDIREASDYWPGNPGKTEMQLSFTYKNKTAKIVVSNIGDRFISSAESMMRSLEEVDLHAICIDIPLENSPNNEAVEWLHRNRFIFGGLMPMIHKEKDYLRLQKILVPINFDLIQVHSETAEELKNFISEEYHALPQEY
ncbi:GNAT family N-acetyltransferase [Aliifodinibius sp. S!AR15-10]|uniref:GNAT family N-acetyltransferase n=1 Tax=Aliifodinibius sp. S!AR15-10 TaxID=2950437 RepID=UPI002864FE1E|nr:GNAT family N-acetyltransferase [Aliifodinibius sp. S!AR15-10]MDR8389647.1 GNAT family N-acetyltransferase [Aliifodinibius sp. S!AR15-10]